MKLWTKVLGLVLACFVTTSLFAAEGEKKRERRPEISFKDMDANADGKVTVDEYVAARLKGVPEDKKEGAKERTTQFAKRLFGDKKELTEDEYKAAREKMMKEFKDKGGKKRGEKKN